MKIVKKDLLKRSILISKVANDPKFHTFFNILVENILYQTKNWFPIVSAGNGGSHTQSSHLISELVGKYKKVRKAINARCLGSDVATLTCIANDFGYENIFSRELESLSLDNDKTYFTPILVVALSTSGNSKNIINLLNTSNYHDHNSFLITGKDGGQAKSIAGYTYTIPSDDTALIQDITQIIIHMICEKIDENQ